jgi:HPt (histidine-containing phosphotransfer) domain-containing protein
MAPIRHRVCVPEELRDLIPRFLANRRADVEQLRTAAQRSDFEAARRIGHMLKGAGGGYGFAEITRLGDEIERLARAGDANLWMLVTELAAYLDALDIDFE